MLRTWLLLPLKLLYAWAVRVRNFFFDHGLARVKKLERPVISVGNLAMGGSGKTPICAELATLLAERGQKVAVLSRGYGRDHPKQCLEVKPDGDWRRCGDEPLLIARRVPRARVFVGPDRYAAATLARDWGPDVYLLDDGFQHRQLHRDLDLVLIDVSQPPPGLLSRGLYREGWSALKRAHAVLLTRCPPQRHAAWFERRIHAAHSGLPIDRLDFSPSALTILPEDARQPLSALKGRKIGAWAGIARPEAFFETLRGLGAEIVVSLPLKDHQPIDEASLNMLSRAALENGADLLVTTEKDAVKLAKNRKFDIVIGYLSIEVRWREKNRIIEILESF